MRHPFTDDIMETKLPSNWKGSTMGRYDVTQLKLYTMDDNIFCKVFPTSLKGATLKWFTGLPSKSINSFETLVIKFGAQFTTSRPHHLTFIALVNIRQEK